jgi:hypothetical protein
MPEAELRSHVACDRAAPGVEVGDRLEQSRDGQVTQSACISSSACVICVHAAPRENCEGGVGAGMAGQTFVHRR